MPKPLRARLDLMPADPLAAPGVPVTATRWILSSGAPVATTIDGLNGDQPVTLITDLATLRLRTSTMALLDHRDGITCEDDCTYPRSPCILGAWEDAQVTAGSDGLVQLSAVPRWRQIQPPQENAWDQDWEARQALDLIAQKIPVQASIGVWQDLNNPQSGFFLLTEATTINGRAIAPDPGRPVYVGRFLDLAEASVCLFGADGRTGAQLSAPRFPAHPHAPAPELPVSDRLRALLALHPAPRHGLVAKLVADNKTDGEIATAISAADVADLQAKITELTTQCAAKDAEIAALKSATAKTAALSALRLPAGAGAGAGETPDQGDAPATLKAALSRSELGDLKGQARLDQAVRLWPHCATR